MSEPNETFEELWEELMENETEFRQRLTQYGTGDKMTISDMDESYSDIKKTLKKIRKLAKEVNG